MSNRNSTETKVIPSKQELLEVIDAFAEHADLVQARLRVLEERNASAESMLQKIDFLIVRMNGPSTQYRDQLEEIINEHGYWLNKSNGGPESGEAGTNP